MQVTDEVVGRANQTKSESPNEALSNTMQHMKDRPVSKIAKRLLAEFWLPIVLTGLWIVVTRQNTGGDPSVELLRSAAKEYGPVFFIICWFTGQVVRVAKHTKDNDKFDKLEARTSQIISDLETQSKRTIENITGGASVPFFRVGGVFACEPCSLVAYNKGESVLFDLEVLVSDDNALIKKIRGNDIQDGLLAWALKIAVLPPMHATPIQYEWSLDPVVQQVFRFSTSARNGFFEQVSIMRFKHGRWFQALRVCKRGDALIEDVDEGFLNEGETFVNWESRPDLTEPPMLSGAKMHPKANSLEKA